MKSKTKKVVACCEDRQSLQLESDYRRALECLAELEESSGKPELIFSRETLEDLIEDYELRHGIEQDDFEVASRIPVAETVDLATFHLSNGNEVRFVVVPELDELFVGEIADAGVEDFLLSPEMPPVEIFKRLAPQNCSVPQYLARLDSNKLLEGRSIVDQLVQPVEVALDQLGIHATPVAAAAGSGSCAPGAAGTNYFLNNHCNTLGGPGYGVSEKYCYAGAYNWIQKTSNKRRRATYTRMASCGTGLNRMKHFYRKVSGYHTQVQVFVDPHKVISWWSAKKGIRRKRRVHFEAHEAGGWVRGWIVYHNQVASGWF